MATQDVQFQFITGVRRRIFRNARLRGSWDGEGRHSDAWTERPMLEVTGDDGCPAFTAAVSLDAADAGKEFRWGVVLQGPQGGSFWGIPTEVHDASSSERYRVFRLSGSRTGQVERYHLTSARRLGANKLFVAPDRPPRLRFAVWAPNARGVEVVFAKPERGYVGDDGVEGVDPARPVVKLSRAADGIWEGGPDGEFAAFLGAPYAYRIVNAQGRTVVRTDIFSRHQVGMGDRDPAHDPSWPGDVETLDGAVSCSAVIDADVVRRGFASTATRSAPDLVPADAFWATEFTPGLPVPTRLEDLVIYELHVGSLGFGKSSAGDLGDAMSFLDHLVDLGVDAVELLPMAEFRGSAMSWGYGDTHHLCVESSAGGRDKYRHFVRACHQRGIAVIQDVVYNHFDNSARRAEWQFDSEAPEQNIYYWYEGRSSDYRDLAGNPFPDGGYLDNGSTGYTPRFWEEMVRQLFVSSAAFLVEEMHVDGLRVDLTQAIHRDNALHADGRGIGSANLFGQKLLREWSRTLRMIRPKVMLVAEDHTGWDAVTKLPSQGGLGFDARWEVAFYHHLIGDSDMAGGRARLLKNAGLGGSEPLRLDAFSGALYGARHSQVVFHESHDEAGNSAGTERTLVVAVNGAPLVGATRRAAEARARVCCGLTLLSPGTPMFFMAEEIGAQKKVTYANSMASREDILGERAGNGKALFRFYQELIALRGRLRSARGHEIDILHHWNASRVIAFKRWSAGEEVIVVASLNDAPFDRGYVIQKDPVAIPDGGWKEIFNSDAAAYGGSDVGNAGAVIPSSGGRIEVVIPANGFVVLARR
jgi:1,4-alpha-glucan branching enzyme